MNTEPMTMNTQENPAEVGIDVQRLVRQVCLDWRNNGMGDECFWEEWPECPTEVPLTPHMVLAAISEANDQSLPPADTTEK